VQPTQPRPDTLGRTFAAARAEHSASAVASALNRAATAPSPASLPSAYRDVPILWFLVIVVLVGGALAIGGPVAGLVMLGGLIFVGVAAFAPGVLFGVYLVIGTYKAFVSQYTPVDISIVLALASFAQIIPVVRDPGSRTISWVGIIVVLAIGFMTIGGLLYAPDTAWALTRVGYFWTFILLPLIPAAIRVGSSPRYLHQFLWTMFAMGVPMVVVGIAQLSDSLLTIFGANTLEVAWSALLIPIVGLGFVIHRSRLLAILTLVLIPPAIFVALASGSRSPILIGGLIGVIAIVRYFSRPSQVNWRATGAIAGLVVALVLAVSLALPDLPGQSTQRFSLFADFVGNTLSGELNTAVGDTSSGTRVQLFGLAVNLFDANPILGVGPGGFKTLSPSYLSTIEAESYPHNAFLQFAAEYGIVGLSIFVVLLWLVVARPLPRRDAITTVRVLFGFWLAVGLVSGDVFGDRTFWGLLVLMLGLDVSRLMGTYRPPAPVPRPQPVIARDPAWPVRPAGQALWPTRSQREGWWPTRAGQERPWPALSAAERPWSAIAPPPGRPGSGAPIPELQRTLPPLPRPTPEQLRDLRRLGLPRPSSSVAGPGASTTAVGPVQAPEPSRPPVIRTSGRPAPGTPGPTGGVPERTSRRRRSATAAEAVSQAAAPPTSRVTKSPAGVAKGPRRRPKAAADEASAPSVAPLNDTSSQPAAIRPKARRRAGSEVSEGAPPPTPEPKTSRGAGRKTKKGSGA
jgi:O-antigen ligase